MVSNTRDRNIDSSRREDSRKGKVDRCEVINVRPHVNPYPDDKDFNTVDVQLIDRPRVSDAALTIRYVKLNSLLTDHGRFQGTPWTPRIGDMIYVYWLAEREALVLGFCTSVEQEPVCRSEATAEHQEIVHKRAPWEQPGLNEDKNYVIFPPPKRPDCFKWWPITRDYITIHDCPYGHNRPQCDKLAPCTCLDDLQAGTWRKVFSDISPTLLDKPRRVKFHHHCGSIYYFDEDGTFHIQGKVAEDPRGLIHHDPTGTMRMRAEPEGEDGAMVRVVAKEDADLVAVEMIWEPNSYVRINKDGSIIIKAATKVTVEAAEQIDLTAPAVNINGACNIFEEES